MSDQPSPDECLRQALTLHQDRKISEAEALYCQILETEPNHPEALHLLGAICIQRKQYSAAIDYITRAIQIVPDNAIYHSNLGGAYQQAALHDKALACFQRTVELSPDFVKAHCDLANAYRRQQDLSAARECYHDALRLEPRNAIAHCGLGRVQLDLGQPHEAVAHFRTALDARPQYVAARVSLGDALKELSYVDEAIDNYKQALQIAPDNVAATNNLGNAYRHQGLLSEAAQCYQRVLAISNRRAEEQLPSTGLQKLRIANLFPPVFENRDEMQLHQRNWCQTIQELQGERLLSGIADLGSSEFSPFNLQFYSGNLRPWKESYATLFAQQLPKQTPLRSLSGLPRIAFVVTHRHELAFIRSMGGVLERMRPGLFELSVVCSQSGAAELRRGIKNDALQILELPLRFDRMLEAIRDFRFDILYYWEIGTDSINYFLPFFRLARIQMTSWGTQVTSGIGEIDYYLSSRWIEGEEAPEHYSEQLILAGAILSRRPRLPPPAAVPLRGEFGFSDEHNLYVCAQQLGKLHLDFDSWLAEILECDPLGRVVLIELGTSIASAKLRRRLWNSAPEVADRIVFLPQMSPPDYLKLLALADVLLDPPHFNGVNSTYDGLSLNKPIVTCPTPYQRGRYTAGCYQRIGWTDLIAADKAEYVRLAVELGTSPDFQQETLRQLQVASKELFEDNHSVSEHERIFQELVETARAKQE